MNQSAFIGGALVAGFALFLAARGRLTTYADVLWSSADKASLPPFGGIPVISTSANSNKPSGGGGGGSSLAIPGAGSFAGAADAAANSNWIGDLAASLPDIAAAAAL